MLLSLKIKLHAVLLDIAINLNEKLKKIYNRLFKRQINILHYNWKFYLTTK